MSARPGFQTFDHPPGLTAAIAVRSRLGLSSELFCSDNAVMLVTQVAGVAVVVCTAKGKRDDVVHYGCYGGDIRGLAHLAEVAGAKHAAVTLLYACPAS